MTSPGITHVMIRVLDFERSKSFYAALGFAEIDRYDFSDFRVCYLGAETGAQIELIENVGRVEPYSLGEGFGNIAFVVSDIAASHRAVASTGAETRQIREIEFSGRLLARYFHAFDPDGYRVEIIERSGRWVKPRPDSSWLSTNHANRSDRS